MAEITLVKGETSALDRTWMSMPDADYRHQVSDLLGRLDDETIALAISGTRELSTAWARLPAGGTLRLGWPLPRAAQPAG